MKDIDPLKYPVNVGDLVRRFDNPLDGINTAAQFAAMANIALKSAGVELVLMVDEIKLKDDNPTDDELIDRAIRVADGEREIITDATARVIAAQLHGGQSSALYALASTGAIDKAALLAEISREGLHEHTSHQVATWLSVLYNYVEAHRERGPVDGWSGLWINEKEGQDDDL